MKTPENQNVPSERISIHCATQETKPLMWLIFPRMIHKSKIKKNRFNGHLHLFFVDLQISYPYNIFFLIASNSKNSSKLWCRRTMWNRSMIASYSVLKKVLRKVYIVVLIKVSLFQNVLLVSLFGQKYQRNYFWISALNFFVASWGASWNLFGFLGT